jgi:hypothetical protein
MYRSVSFLLIFSAGIVSLSIFPAAKESPGLIVGAEELSPLLGIATGDGKAHGCKARLCSDFFACCIACASSPDHTAERLTADAHQGLQEIVGDQDVLKKDYYSTQCSLSTSRGPWPHRISFIMDDKNILVTYRFAHEGGGWGETSKLWSWVFDKKQVVIVLNKLDKNQYGLKAGSTKVDFPDIQALAKRGLGESSIMAVAVHRSKLLDAWAASRANAQAACLSGPAGR